LTEEGELEAKLFGSALSNTPWAEVYTSDLPRAYLTCNFILQQSLFTPNVFSTSLFREVCFGVREGLPRGTSINEAKSLIAVRESITDISMIQDHAEVDADVHHRQWEFINHMIEDLST